MALSHDTRLFVFARDDYRCPCGKIGSLINRYGKPTLVENPNGIHLETLDFYNGLDVIPFELHHKLPKSKGGGDNPDNLQLLCRRCNRYLGNKTGANNATKKNY